MGRSQVAYNRKHGRGGGRGGGRGRGRGRGKAGRGHDAGIRTTKKHVVDGDNSWRYQSEAAPDRESDLESRVQALEAHGANYSQFGTTDTDETGGEEAWMAGGGLDLPQIAKTLRTASLAQRLRIDPRIISSLETGPQLDTLTGSAATSLATDNRNANPKQSAADTGAQDGHTNEEVVDEEEEELNAWLDDMIS